MVAMATVAMVTMATMKMIHFEPQNHIFGLGATTSKGLHEIFSINWYVVYNSLAILSHSQPIVLYVFLPMCRYTILDTSIVELLYYLFCQWVTNYLTYAIICQCTIVI